MLTLMLTLMLILTLLLVLMLRHCRSIIFDANFQLQMQEETHKQVDYALEEKRLQDTPHWKNGRAFPIQKLERKSNFCRTEDKECLRCQSVGKESSKFSSSSGSNGSNNIASSTVSADKQEEGLLISKPSTTVLPPIYELVRSCLKI